MEVPVLRRTYRIDSAIAVQVRMAMYQELHGMNVELDLVEMMLHHLHLHLQLFDLIFHDAHVCRHPHVAVLAKQKGVGVVRHGWDAR